MRLPIVPTGRFNPIRLIYKTYLNFTEQKLSLQGTSNIPIDILIPVADKDLSTLHYAVHYARKNILNPISEVYIIGKSKAVEDFCNQNNCRFLVEDIVLPIKKQDIKFNGAEWSRAGWLLQQLIKLNSDNISSSEKVLVLDADTCIISPQVLISNEGKIIMHYSDEYHFPYAVYSKILGLNKRYYLSFVAHHMIFDRNILQSLKKDIENFSGKTWIETILTTIDFNENSSFSEYEMYGNYAYFNFRKRIHLEYWRNKSLDSNLMTKETIEKFSKKYKSISFHTI
ncbi:MAG: DUF6492 family protein [Saprospiraceae bacterium]